MSMGLLIVPIKNQTYDKNGIITSLYKCSNCSLAWGKLVEHQCCNVNMFSGRKFTKSARVYGRKGRGQVKGDYGGAQTSPSVGSRMSNLNSVPC